MAVDPVRTQKTLDNIARGVEIGTAGLSLLERIIALFRPKPPEKKAAALREKAAGKREKAAASKRPAPRKRLTKAAERLEDRADKLAPATAPTPETEK